MLHWLRWAHIGVAGARCEIVLALRDGQQVPSASWSGDIDAQFTRTLSRVAMDLLLEGATMDQLSRVLQVPFADLWKFKFRLDQGKTPAPAQLERRNTMPMPLTATDDALPDPSDPLWLALLHGERELDVRTLSLKLLLTKLRAQAHGIRDDEVMMLKMVELHRFFERHQVVLQHEIAQLQRGSLH